MAQTNALGHLLTYVSTAYKQAFPPPAMPDRTNKPDRAVRIMLEQLGKQHKYQAYDAIDVEDAIKLATTSAWVYGAIKAISDRIASRRARFRVKRQVGEQLEDVYDHSFERLINHPNPLMPIEYILRYTTFWLLLHGNAYWFVSTNAPGRGEPEEIWPIPNFNIKPMPDTIRKSKVDGKLIVDYAYEVNGKKMRLPGENVVHFRLPNPFDYWFGLSPLSAAIHAVRTDFVQGKFMYHFFGPDNAIPTAVISLPPETSPEDFEMAKDAIRQQFGEGRRSAIVRAGDMSVQPIFQTLQQMEIMAAREFNQREINYIYGIPQGLIGGMVPGDSGTSAEIGFARTTVQPLIDLIAAWIHNKLAGYYKDDIVIAAADVVPPDKMMLLQEMTIHGQHLTINEIRQQYLNKPELRLDNPMLDMLLDIPTSLLAFASSTTASEGMTDPPPEGEEGGEEGPSSHGKQPPAYANQEKPYTLPDGPGLQGPKNEADRMAVRTAEALRIAMDEEIKQWRKVVRKAAQEGQSPDERPFEAKFLPEDMVASIRDQLRVAHDTDAVFRDYRNGRNETKNGAGIDHS